MSNVLIFEALCDRLRRLFAQPWTAFVLLPIICLSLLLASSPADPDLFARVAIGRLIEVTGTVPLHDTFAFTEKLPMWIDHEWLSGVVFWSVASEWGDVGLILLKGLLVTITLLVVVAAARLYAPQCFPQLLWMATWILGALFAWGGTIRCQTFSYLFIAFEYFALLSFQRKGTAKYIFALPLISVVWVNLHGGYALGLITLWLWVATSIMQRERVAPLVVVALACSAAPAFTPYGYSTFASYLWKALSMDRPGITEWAPLWESPASFVCYTLLALPVVFGIQRSGPLSRHIQAIALLSFAAYAGARHIRLLAFTGITFAIFGTGFFHSCFLRLREWRPERAQALARSAAFLGALAVLAAIVRLIILVPQARTYELNLDRYPMQATETLRTQKLSGRLLVDFNTGSFALWRLYPNFTISMDGRYEEVYSDNMASLNAHAFEFETPRGAAALARINPTHILLPVSDPDFQIPTALRKSWHVIYRDRSWIILSSNARDAIMSPSMPVSSLWMPLF